MLGASYIILPLFLKGVLIDAYTRFLNLFDPFNSSTLRVVLDHKFHNGFDISAASHCIAYKYSVCIQDIKIPDSKLVEGAPSVQAKHRLH